jgi:hypothetical protein
MKDLVSLVEQYRPGFASGLAPATDQALGALQRRAGRIPGAYLRFLQTTGGKPNALQLESVHLGVHEALKAHLGRPFLKDARFMYLAHDRGDDVLEYWMDREAPIGADDCVIVVGEADSESAPVRKPFSASLEDFLYFHAFVDHVVPSFEHSQWGYLPRQHSPDDVDLALLVPLTLGFTRRARPLHNAIYERDGAAIAIRRDPDGFVGIYLAAHDKDELDALAAAFSAASGYRTG